MSGASQTFWTLFADHNNGDGRSFLHRSVLKMCTKKEEVLLYNIQFESKANRHHLFDKWAGIILAEPGMKKLFNDMGISRAIAQARKMTVDRKPIDGVSHVEMEHWGSTFVVAWMEFGPLLEDMAMLTSLPIFWRGSCCQPDNKRFDTLTSFLLKSKYSTNKMTYCTGSLMNR